MATRLAMGVVTGVAIASATGWAVLVGLLYVMQRSILFVPDVGRPDPASSRVPAMQRVHARTSDGLTLEGWWHPPRSTRPTILYFHGNGGNLGDRDEKARRILERGYGLLLAGYRGYGGNPGAPSEAGLIDDARAWMRHLDQQGVPARMVVLYGESLGSGVAAALASERRVAALVLEAPFTSIADIAAARYWFVPARRLILDPFDTRSRLPMVEAPLLILHGSGDRVVPVTHGEALFAAAGEPKRFVRIEGGRHSDLFDHGALDALDDFLQKQISPATTLGDR